MSENDRERWQDEMYSRIYNEELRGLERRRAGDPSLTAEDIRLMLKDLYVLDGSDWLGRGEAGDITSNATIAAYEAFAAAMDAE
jgi:hypothetical protein